MCLFPRKIKTPFNAINVNGGQPLLMEVPCNKCAECKKAARLLWHFRTFHEALACTNAGGFVLYDTLTYSDEYLPHLSDYIDLKDTGINDFSCFNHQHYRDFFKRLRRKIEYHNKGVTLRYFLTTEYGTDDRYTHRPHLHLLIFCYTNGVPFNSRILSKYISECWTYGRTDGIPYKPIAYVRENTFQKTAELDYKPYLRVCNYVSKYITKDSTFSEQIEKRKLLINKHITDKEEVKKLYRNIDMFHRQSQGFGINYLETLSADEKNFILNNGACRIVDGKKVTLTIPLPLYYKRKLFFKAVNYKHNGEKKTKWIPTPAGCEYIENQYIKNINKQTKQLKDAIINLPNIEQYRIKQLLAGRELFHLAIYNLFYKGYSRDFNEFVEQQFLYKKIDLNDKENDLYTWIERIIRNKQVVYTDSYDYLPIEHKTNSIQIQNHISIIQHNSTDIYEYNKILPKIIFTQDSTPHFKNFDEINHILRTYMLEDSRKKQTFFEHTENMIKRYKYLFNT